MSSNNLKKLVITCAAIMGIVGSDVHAAGNDDHGFEGKPFKHMSDVEFSVNKKIVFVFYSPTCSACTVLAEPLNEIAAQATNVEVYKVNGADKTGDIPLLKELCKVEAYPTLASIDITVSTKKLVGAPQPKQVLMNYFGVTGTAKPAKPAQAAVQKPSQPSQKTNGSGNGSKKSPKQQIVLQEEESIYDADGDELVAIKGMEVLPAELEEPDTELLDIRELIVTDSKSKRRGRR